MVPFKVKWDSQFAKQHCQFSSPARTISITVTCGFAFNSVFYHIEYEEVMWARSINSNSRQEGCVS